MSGCRAPIRGAPGSPRARALPRRVGQLGVDLGVQQFRRIGNAVVLHPRLMRVPVQLEQADTARIAAERIPITLAIHHKERIFFKFVGPSIAHKLFEFGPGESLRWHVFRWLRCCWRLSRRCSC